MRSYEEDVSYRLKIWQRNMTRKPSVMNKLAARVQYRMNKLIPEKIHMAITTAIKQMIKGVLLGAEIINSQPKEVASLAEREAKAQERINFYRKTAAAEGGITGAGGILLGLADFPLLIGIKMKLLFEIASCYGFSVADYKERLFILYIFQLAFSSQEKRNQVYQHILNWQEVQQTLPDDINAFDWRTFQQEYRDYIDLAKIAQLIPVIGAPVGAVVNYQLISKLGNTAMNAYRLRWLEQGESSIVNGE